MNLLPSRPLRLDTKSFNKDQRKLWSLCIIAFVMACGVFVFAAGLGKDIFQERALWTRGVIGEITHISGEETATGTSFLWDHAYDLKVTYLDDTGKQYAGKVKFNYMFSKLNENSPVELRYDPKSPNLFVLSWQARGGWPRWGMFALACAVVLALFSFIPLTIRKVGKLKTLLKKVAQDGEELWVEVVNLGYVYGAPFLTYMIPGADKKGKARRKQRLSVPPLIVHRDGKNFAIALRSPQEQKNLYFVPNDLEPFAFTAEEKQRIARTLASYRSN
jgi:hypothetical protein